MTLTDNTRRTILLGLLLAVVTFVTFAPVLRNDFVRYDDRIYVTDNPRVLSGLSPANLVWAFTSGYASNWHPLTWISHMLDIELFGLSPSGHHLTSVLIHVINSILLFVMLRGMTRAEWPSWVVAALFALHPLRLESVAWVAERKDVLSAFFLFLMLWNYTRYVQDELPKSKKFHYWAALACFTLGLMSKPMLVSAPVLMLLLDVWPLNRLWSASAERPSSTLRRLIREKIPFLLLAVISSTITFVVQEKAQSATLTLPLAPRLANAVASYWKYLGKLIWPTELAVFYPHPDTNYPQSDQWPWWIIAVAAVLLLAITAGVVARWRKTPWLATGWLWYLVSLVPVIGLVQVGRQAMADRYTYIPLIGIYVILVWAVAALLKHRPGLKPVVGALAACVLLLFGLSTATQARYWQNNFTLFERALQVAPHNAIAHTMLGIEHGERGDYQVAIEHFEKAIKTAPSDAEPRFGLGYTFELLKQPEKALDHYRAALNLQPNEPKFHNRVGELLRSLGDDKNALAHFSRAVELNPDFWQARVNVGLCLSDAGDLPRAQAQFEIAAGLAPYASEPLLRLAEILMKQGRLREAEGRFRQLIRLHSDNSDHYVNLGGLLWFMGRHEEALEAYQQAVRLRPDYPVARYNLGITLLALGQNSEAAAQFGEAVRLKPDHAEALTGWGRSLAGMSNFEEALRKFDQSLAIRPDGFTWQQIARVRLALNQPRQAIDALSEAIKLRPDWPPALNDLAWILATHRNESVRDPGRAIELAEQAVRLTATNNPAYLATLDASYAQNARFPEAISTAEKARKLALDSGQQELAKAAEDRLKLYKEGRAFVE